METALDGVNKKTCSRIGYRDRFLLSRMAETSKKWSDQAVHSVGNQMWKSYNCLQLSNCTNNVATIRWTCMP